MKTIVYNFGNERGIIFNNTFTGELKIDNKYSGQTDDGFLFRL